MDEGEGSLTREGVMNRFGMDRVALLGLAFLWACDSTGPMDTAERAGAAGTIASAVSDGAHGGGNPHFFFLPPLVRSPSVTNGEFDPLQQPEVHVCRWSDGACQGEDVARFTMLEGEGSEIVRLEPGNEHYIVNWHTRDMAAGIYRIWVSVQAVELGYVDVELVARSRGARPGTEAMTVGRTIPIKVRIERGAVPDVRPITVGAGLQHTCGLDAEGHAWCWGDNYYGQLGTGTAGGASSIPVRVTGGLAFRQVVATRSSTCGLDEAGVAYCWGSNYEGELGLGAVSDPRAAPVAVGGGHRFRQLAAGAFHVCGVSDGSGAWCWGYNELGTIGSGSFGNAGGPAYLPTPTQVLGGHGFSAIGAGAFHNCAIDADRALWCWGFGYYGQLGNGLIMQAAPYGSAVPVAVEGAYRFSSIAAGGYHTCATTEADAALCWGYDFYGQVGAGAPSLSPPYSRSLPTGVAGGHAFRQLASGGYHSCGIEPNGNLLCWGGNFFGQLGRGFLSRPPDAEGIPTPGPTTATLAFVAVAAGYQHTCAITPAGSAYCWGSNDYGQAGIGSFTWVPLASPRFVTGGVTFWVP